MAPARRCESACRSEETAVSSRRGLVSSLKAFRFRSTPKSPSERPAAAHGYFNILQRLKHSRIVISANKCRPNTVHKCRVNVAPWKQFRPPVGVKISSGQHAGPAPTDLNPLRVAGSDARQNQTFMLQPNPGCQERIRNVVSNFWWIVKKRRARSVWIVEEIVPIEVAVPFRQRPQMHQENTS